MNDQSAPFKRRAEAGVSWGEDIRAELAASRRRAWVIAGVAAGVAVIEALALVVLSPLRTLVPYTLLVDRQTGYVQMIQGLKPGPISDDAAVTQSFLVQYVIGRESFDAADLRDSYKHIMLWSTPDVRRQYAATLARSNPASPLRLYSPTTIISTTVKSIRALGSNSALVRFSTSRQDAGSIGGEQHDYAAVVGYRYSGAPKSMDDRLINPLGFQVTSYRRDLEAPGGTVTAGGAVAP